VLAILPAVMLLGCDSPEAVRHRGLNYYLSSAQDLRSIGRVAFVELAEDDRGGQIAADTTDELAVALRDNRLFAVNVLHSSDPQYAHTPTDSPGGLTFEQIAALHKDLDCDAILLGTITTYQPYPHMRMGLQLKLLDLRSGQLVWAIDQVWDTTEARMEERLKKFFSTHMGKNYEPLGWRLALTSPRAFEKFVAWDAASTLPHNEPQEPEKEPGKLNLSDFSNK
jgi:hypothetical protein